MLEKIGLPSKPSVRGNNWVVDASHCQGCSSQFTFINRKHHCRRCGGLFCNSCTQQRMVLRGQGDSPVRICDACKKLEEASRFEMRHGHKNRAGRGSSKLAAKDEEDELLNQLLSNGGKSSMSSRSSSSIGILSSEHPKSGASGSNIQGTIAQDERGGTHGSISSEQPTDVSTTVVSATPEELRQQAAEEKKKHRTLKAEGKPEEALRAFKRGKELEREAAALEINLRKQRRKALSVSSNASELSNVKNDAKTSSPENKLPPQRKKEKDDLTAELKELGWSDMDLHDVDKKPATSLEGELTKLLGEVSQGANTENRTHGTDRSQVNAHKRKALELKRQGKLAEAKEELKKAKVLEKEIEERELLGEDEDSDEEFSSLIRSLDFDKNEDLSIGYDLDHGLDFDSFGGFREDIGVDDDLEVTRDDMRDPDMLAALQSLGWAEDTTDAEDLESQFEDTADTEALVNEIQSLKKEALNQKRAGNSKEALALFRKAKLLQKELDSASQGTNLITDNSVVPSESSEVSINHSDVDVGNVHEGKDTSHKIAPKSKSAIQKELLGVKKRALALRREGKLSEAEEELKKGKVLEKQLEELENPSKVGGSSFPNKQTDDSMITDAGDEEVTDQDMNDPTYLSLLKNLGWSEDANENHPPSSSEKVAPAASRNDDSSNIQASVNVQAGVSRKSKSEIQRELLGLKRKSLALRRQGETAEAEEVRKRAEALEAQLAEMEAPTQTEHPAETSKHKEHNVPSPSLSISGQSSELNTTQSPVIDLSGTGLATADRQKEMINQVKERVSESTYAQGIASQNDGASLQKDILAHKRKALAFKREGKLAEAKEELRQAKLLEKSLEENKSESQPNESSGTAENEPQPNPSSNELPGSDFSGEKDSSPDSAPKTLSSRDRYKLQRESLNHKRQALKLRREGRTEEADAEFELAKALEAQLEESSSQNATEPVDDAGVEDFLDPQLFSALKAIGLDDVSSGTRVPEKREPKKQAAAPKIDNSNEERLQLEEQIKAEKMKALNFKRSGKQAEALDALRTARVLEKKLNSLTPK